MWTIVLAGFCIGVINLAEPAPEYSIMVKMIEDGQLQLDVNEICKDAGYVRVKRNVGPISPDMETLTAVSPTAKESDHDATHVGKTTSNYYETVNAKGVTNTERGDEVTAENLEKIVTTKNMPFAERDYKSTMEADYVTATSSDKKVIRTAKDDTVTESDPGAIVSKGAVSDTDSTDRTTVSTTETPMNDAEDSIENKHDKSVTDENSTAKASENDEAPNPKSEYDEVIISTTDKYIYNDDYYTSTEIEGMKNGYNVNVKSKNDTSSGMNHDTTEAVGTKAKLDANVIHTNDTSTDSNYGIKKVENVTTPKSGDDVVITSTIDPDTYDDYDDSNKIEGMKNGQDVTVTSKNDTGSGIGHNKTEAVGTKAKLDANVTHTNDTCTDSNYDKHYKTVTVKNTTANASEHDVAPNPVDKENTDTLAKSTGAEPVVGVHDTSGNSMGVLGILLSSLAIAGVIIGATRIVYKLHKANSYVLPEPNVPEATPLNHIA